MDSIGKNIQHYRKLLRIKQIELAEKVNVSYTYLGYIEQGKRLPSVDLLVEIAMFLKLPLAALVSDELYDVHLFEKDDFIAELSMLNSSELEKALTVLRVNYETICL